MSEFVFPHALKKRLRVSLLMPVLSVLMFGMLLMLSFFLLAEVFETRGSAYSLAALLILPVFWIGFVFFAALTVFPRIVLHPDHLSYQNYWIKREAFYRDITKIEVEYLGNVFSSSDLKLRLYQRNDGDAPVKMSIGAVTPKECVALLNFLKKRAPGAAMNDVAAQIKNGNVPAV